jgi:hypothetical protein
MAPKQQLFGLPDLRISGQSCLFEGRQSVHMQCRCADLDLLTDGMHSRGSGNSWADDDNKVIQSDRWAPQHKLVVFRA